jgi:hypothetical protein
VAEVLANAIRSNICGFVLLCGCWCCFIASVEDINCLEAITEGPVNFFVILHAAFKIKSFGSIANN